MTMECHAYKVDLKLDLEIQQRAGQREYWAVVASDLGIVAYGDSEKEAVANLDESVGVLLESFSEYPDAVGAMKQYFDFHGVKYKLNEKPEIQTFSPGLYEDLFESLAQASPGTLHQLIELTAEPVRREHSLNGELRVPVSG